MDLRFYFKNSNRSFTLIELLVVISIIGLLASLVLVSTRGLQQKAKITKTLEFSQSLNNSLGAYALGVWGFDQGPAGSAMASAPDASGYGNNGSCSGGSCPVYSADTPYAAIGRGTGRFALSFDGVNDYVDIGSRPTLNNISGSVTFEAWIKSNDAYPNFILDKNNHFAYWQNVLYFRISGTPYTWNPNVAFDVSQWNHFAASFNSANGRVSLYKNGVERWFITQAGSLSANVGGLSIGSDNPPGPPYYNGLMDEVRIYERALTLSEIQQHYAEGLERHQNLAIK